MAHHLTIEGERRRLMIATLRYPRQFVKLNGVWLFSERLLYVDWGGGTCTVLTPSAKDGLSSRSAIRFGARFIETIVTGKTPSLRSAWQRALLTP